MLTRLLTGLVLGLLMAMPRNRGPLELPPVVLDTPTPDTPPTPPPGHTGPWPPVPDQGNILRTPDVDAYLPRSTDIICTSFRDLFLKDDQQSLPTEGPRSLRILGIDAEYDPNDDPFGTTSSARP